MKAEYKRDLQNNYLILELNQENTEAGYCLRMAEQNAIQGLLEFYCSKRDGKQYLHYEITSRQTLEGLYERKLMGYQDILNLLTDIRDTIEGMQRYLLEPAHLIFAPEYIFAGTDHRISFCYFPEIREETKISVLAEFILKKLDHEDSQAVSLGYRFYQSVCMENFSLGQVWKELITVSEKQQEKRLTADEESPKTERPKRNFRETYDTDSYFELPEAFDEQELEVVHKERRRKRDSKWLDRLFAAVHPLVLLSGLFFLAVLEILFYFQLIQLTEAGGLFFLILSAELLVNRFWKSRKEKKKEYRQYREDDEEEVYEELQKEMYRTEEEEIGETCCLTDLPAEGAIRLIYIGGGSQEGVYPDIRLGNEVLYVGKRKGESDILLNSPAVSRMHARLEGRGSHYFVKDLNSRNGTYWNKERLRPQEEREIFPGDCISFAQVQYRAVRL